MAQHFLVGKTIKDIQIASDKKALLFVCDDGDHIARTYGGCCSESWVENVDLNLLRLPCRVLLVEDLEAPEDERSEYGEVVTFYGMKITTDTGAIEIDYRNESNGYYGGNLHWPDDGYFYGGVFGQNVSTEEWQKPP